MENPSLNVDGVNYGEPSLPFVVVWAGTNASEFQTEAEARSEINRRETLQKPEAFGARFFKIDDQKENWITA